MEAELSRLVRRMFALEAEMTELRNRIAQLVADEDQSLRSAMLACEPQTKPHSPQAPTPQMVDRGVTLISGHFERRFQRLMMGRDLVDVRRWLESGIPADRVVEAITAVFEAEHPPKNRWRAIHDLLRNTPGSEPLEWSSDTRQRPRDPSLDRLLTIREQSKRRENDSTNGNDTLPRPR